jgi:class 3 adenylate cyclase/tetratricopeptide (TPR) repeat protein
MDTSRERGTVCLACGAPSPAGMAFCGSCGTPLSLLCHSCGSKNPGSFHFCGTCGSSLVHHPELDPLALGGSGELRQLTVMFCDLADSTALAERLGPEAFREVVSAHHTGCTDVVRRFGGHVAQYLGDGLLVYFGYPQAHEDDAQRAVHSGLEIIRGTQVLNERSLHERGVHLAIRIGIHTGPVVAGIMGAGTHWEQLAVGQAPHIAARLQALALPGKIVVSAATHALVRGFFVSEPLGPQVLRGVSQPMDVFQIVRDTGIRSRFEVALAAGLTPSVDRQRELATLVEAFARVENGASEIVWVVGDAGIGKSRLLQMFQEHSKVLTPSWLLCRCGAYSQHSALHPIIELFERIFGFESDDAPAERLHKLEATLTTYGPFSDDAVPLLSGLLSLPISEPAAALLSLAPERQRDRTFDILITILVRMAERRPVILGIEDLHWADPSTLDFLARIREGAPTARVMLLLTHRPVFSATWTAKTPAIHIRLDRLSDEHVRSMVQHIAGGKRIPEEVHRYVVEKTDGVPIFVEELTRTVLESGWLVDTDGGFAPARPLHMLTIPVTLQDLLLARLDRLGRGKEVALLASVIGREFSYEMIRAVSHADEIALNHDLGQLVSGGVLYQLSEPPAARYVFKHVLIQDAAYGLLLKSTRQQYHRRVAEALLAGFPETVATRPELLAHHFTEAGSAQVAVDYWLKACRRAVERSANLEASAHAHQGLTLLEQVPASPARDVLELGLQSALGSATIALRGYGADAVEKAFARALDLCQRLGDTPQRIRAELGLWTYYVVRGHYAHAVELADELLAIARQHGTTGTLVQAHYCRGFSRFHVGELHAAHEAFAEGARVACRDGDPALSLPTGDDVRIHLLSFSALALWHLGQPAAATTRSQEALLLARRLGHPYGIAFAANVAGFLGIYLRDIESARAAAAETIALASDKGYRYFMLLGNFTQAWSLAQSGAMAEGLATMTQCIKGLRASGARMAETFMILQLAQSFLQNGQLDEARAHLHEAEDTARASGERLFEPEINRVLGECHAATDAIAADRYFRVALDQARSHGDRAQEIRAAMSLARVWRDNAERRAELQTLLATATAACAPSDVSADVREARALLARLS